MTSELENFREQLRDVDNQIINLKEMKDGLLKRINLLELRDLEERKEQLLNEISEERKRQYLRE